MTEAEWLTSTDIPAMLQYALPAGVGRKVRLFNCACARALVPWVTDTVVVKALDASERYADGLLRDSTLDGWRRKVFVARTAYRRRTPVRSEGVEELALHAASYATNADRFPGYRIVWSEILRLMPYHGPDQTDALRQRLPAFLRDVVGNPYRPVAFVPDWRTESAVALARTMYEARTFDRLPILADALEEAGCDVPDVLAHCRDPEAVHVRGCWVIDGVLGYT